MNDTKNCHFCAIAEGHIQGHVVWSDSDLLAFLDRNPIRPGHLQLITRAHYPYFDDLPETLATRLILTGQILAKRLKAIYGVVRVGFVCTGGDVAHCHAHLVPLKDKTDITSLRYFEATGIKVADRPLPSWDELEAEAIRLR